MAAVGVQPFIMRDVLFKVGADSYEAAVSQVVFTPRSQVVRWKGLTPSSVHAFPTTADWDCQITYAQDLTTVGSLTRYLHANEGAVVAAEFEPINGGSAVTANVIITPGALGGTVDQVATAQVTLGVSGKPAIEALGG